MNYKQIPLYFALCCGIWLPAISQSSFQNIFHYPGFSASTGAVIQLPSGQIAVGGQVTNEQTGQQDAALFLLSSTGDLLWARMLDASHSPDLVIDLESTADGKILAVLGSYAAPSGFCGLLKIDRNGVIEWSKSYASSGSVLNKATQTPFGIILTGWSGNPRRGLIARIDEGGQELWRVLVSQPGVALECNDAWEDVQGFLYISGTYNNSDGFVLKLFNTGVLEWARRIGTPEYDGLQRIVPLPDNTLLLGGSTQRFEPYYRVWLAKMDRNGSIKWSRAYGETDDDLVLRDLIVQGASPVFCLSGVGSTPNLGAGLARINDSGDLLWIKNLDPAGSFAMTPFLSAASNNNLLVASDLQTGAGRDFYVVRTNAVGDAPPCCIRSFNLSVLDMTVENQVFVPDVGAAPALAPGAWTATAYSPERSSWCVPVNTSFSLSDTLICPGECVDLEIDDPDPATQYTWSYPGGKADAQLPGRVCFQTDSSHTVITLTANGCVYQQSRDTLYFDDRAKQYPNAFTPNSDGANDIFLPVMFCPVLDYHLAVYNRWGELVFETVESSQGWDGTIKGQVAPVDVYAWVLEFRSGASRMRRTGSVTLLR